MSISNEKTAKETVPNYWSFIHEVKDSLSSFLYCVVLAQQTRLPAHYCILFFLARYSVLYVVPSYHPPWLLLNPTLPVSFIEIKVPTHFLEGIFQPFSSCIFSKIIYLGLYLSSMSLYRHDQKKNNFIFEKYSF